MAFNQKPRGGRRWFAVESKSFELLIDEVGGKLRGCIWERCKGITSWIRFGDASLSSLLAGVESCCRGRDDRSWSLVWDEEGRKYRMERRSNEAGRFLLCSVCDLEAKRFCLIFPEGKGLFGGWNILAEKLREVGVAPFGGLKDPLSFEVLKKEKDLEPRTFVDVAKSKMGRLGDKVWLEVGRRVTPGRLEQLGPCLVGRWEKAWVRVVGLPLHLWNREVFKLIGDGCGGFIAVDDKTDSMTKLQWARLLVKMAGSLLGKGATVDEVETGSGSRAVCRGSVLEKDVQPKEQAGVQVEPPCGSSSKGAIDGEDSLGNRSQDAGKVPRPITLKGWVLGCEERPFYIKGSFVGCEGMAGMGFEPGLGGIKGVRAHSHAEVGEMEVRATKEASRVQVREDVGVACFLGGDWRDSEAFSVKARALMTDEALTAEASRYESFPAVFGGDQVFFSSSPSSGCDRALVVGGAPLRAVLTDGSLWVTGTEGEKYMGNRLQIENRRDQGKKKGIPRMSSGRDGGGFLLHFLSVQELQRWFQMDFLRVYGPTMKDRELFWEELGAIRGLWNDPWCIKRRRVSASMRRFSEALKAILKSWNKDVFGKVGVNKKLALDKVAFWDAQEKLRPLSMEELEARKEAKGDFEKWALMEEVSWRQKSREVIDVEEAARLEEVFSEEEVFSALSDLNGTRLLVQMVSLKVDRVDFLVHLHSIVFCLGQWHSGRFLQQFKGAASGEPPFSLSFSISGLRINLDKSEILLVGRVENLEALALEVGCKVGRLPSSYLGIPLGANHKSVAVWDGVEERFRKRVAMWKRQFISKGGRITLIRSTLSSMPIYLMSLLRMPRVVRGALERKPHLVNWDIVCLDKRKGGLGVRRLSTLNRALLCKWNWRFANERENLWRHVISRKFGEEEGGWYTREVREGFGVGFWMEIRKEGALLQNKVVFSWGMVENAVERDYEWDFLVKSLYNVLASRRVDQFPNSMIWSPCVPTKVSFFA
ncbi:hypothetical protein AAG906_033664 [Vitis piasezkii]